MSINVSPTRSARPSRIPSLIARLPIHLALASAALAFGAAVNPAQAANGPACEIDRPVKFGGMNWESN
ncbi:MAG TPA: glycine/betaine ABC transporter substrate-binding protein, partial [Burkholderiaceae bacterium]|nr:glycine/betaine ABC transporter substrate-binding protein [Burkholderiaceae bacterium]